MKRKKAMHGRDVSQRSPDGVEHRFGLSAPSRSAPMLRLPGPTPLRGCRCSHRAVTAPHDADSKHRAAQAATGVWGRARRLQPARVSYESSSPRATRSTWCASSRFPLEPSIDIGEAAILHEGVGAFSSRRRMARSTRIADGECGSRARWPTRISVLRLACSCAAPVRRTETRIVAAAVTRESAQRAK